MHAQLATGEVKKLICEFHFVLGAFRFQGGNKKYVTFNLTYSREAIKLAAYSLSFVVKFFEKPFEFSRILQKSANPSLFDHLLSLHDFPSNLLPKKVADAKNHFSTSILLYIHFFPLQTRFPSYCPLKVFS